MGWICEAFLRDAHASRSDYSEIKQCLHDKSDTLFDFHQVVKRTPGFARSDSMHECTTPTVEDDLSGGQFGTNCAGCSVH
jgi:hypothetical protein